MRFLKIRPGVHWLIAVPFLLFFSVSGGCKESGWPLWDAYQARFIDAQGRVFDPQGDQHTTSEGQAYALFFSLVADRRATFDRVLSWTQGNLASGNLSAHLPAWLWGKDKDGQWKALDPNPASDADVWMAYTLLEAGRLWNSPAYTQLGHSMLALIAKTEVAELPGFGTMLMPGPAGFEHGKSWTLNPSYLPEFLFQRLGEEDPSGPWLLIAGKVPSLLEQSARHGYAMDWVDYVPGEGFSPQAEQRPDSDRATSGPGGSYDAIRVYLWAGMIDSTSPVRSRILRAVPAMAAYLADHDVPPEKVNEDGIPVAQSGPVGFSAAVLPYLRAFPNSSESCARQVARLAKEQDKKTGLYGQGLAYYDQNLTLFSTGFMDGRFRFGTGGELKVEWKLR